MICIIVYRYVCILIINQAKLFLNGLMSCVFKNVERKLYNIGSIDHWFRWDNAYNLSFYALLKTWQCFRSLESWPRLHRCIDIYWPAAIPLINYTLLFSRKLHVLVDLMTNVHININSYLLENIQLQLLKFRIDYLN